jgi:DNA-binding response OmpR family regulator
MLDDPLSKNNASIANNPNCFVKKFIDKLPYPFAFDLFYSKILSRKVIKSVYSVLERYVVRNIKVLIVEDDELACELISTYLTDSGFDVTAVFTATDGISHAKQTEYEILLLDLNLPDFNGFEVLKGIKDTVPIPTIVLSAYSDTKSKILAFRYGANDYMVKPIDLEELEARIWVQLSRHSAISAQSNDSTFVVNNFNIYFNKELLDLTSIEFKILAMLIKHKNQTIARKTLVSLLSTLSSDRSLDNHIKNIRKKLGDTGRKTKYLRTEYGVGYKLVV